MAMRVSSFFMHSILHAAPVRTTRRVMAMSLLAVLACWCANPLHAAAQPADERAIGTWQGVIELPAAKLRIVVHIARSADGALTGTLDSVDQGARGIPIEAVAVMGNTLRFTINAISGRYAGDFAADGQRLDGQWAQGANTLPLNLRRDAALPVVQRPQDPVRPLPYAEVEATYDSAPGVTLAATLTLPPGKGPFPAVLLISGSGAQDRDSAVAGHRPFLVLADALTRRGIAVLRADDRGFARSTGDARTATTEDYAGDALAGVRWLLARPDIDAQRIGLIGHSEGAVVAPLAVTGKSPEASRVAFLVLLAPPAVPLGEILKEQQRLVLASQGAPAASITRALATQRRLNDIVLREPDPARAATALRAVLAETIATLPEAARARAQTQLEAQVTQMNTPWLRWMLAYDPAPALARLRVPVLALFGGLDNQVVPAQNRPPLEAALRSRPVAGTEVRELPGLNHLFQSARTGSPVEYAQIAETMNPELLKQVGDWVLARQATP